MGNIQFNGGKMVFVDGKIGMGSGCCTDCPPPSCEDTGKPICYVDKHATGAGDGSSWADAYTTIAGGNTKALTHRVYVKGYGSGDPYSENIGGIDLVGIGDVWVNGRCTPGASYFCIYNITLTGSTTAYGGKFLIDGKSYGKFVGCSVKNVSTTGHGSPYPILCGFRAIGSGSGNEANYCTVDNVENTSAYGWICGFESEATNSLACDNCYAGSLTSPGWLGDSVHGAYGFYRITGDYCLASQITATGTSSYAYGYRFGTITNSIADQISGVSFSMGFDAANPGSNSCTDPQPADGCFP